MNTIKIVLASIFLLPAISALSNNRVEAQVCFNYNCCPSGMVRTYDAGYGDYVCSYPSRIGFTYYRPNVSVGVYWGSGYRPYRYPAYPVYRYPRYTYRYHHHHPHHRIR